MRPFNKIFLLSLAMLILIGQMSISVISAQDNTALSFTVNMSTDLMIQLSGNQPTEKEAEAFKELLSKNTSPPFYALIRDYPDITCWMYKLNINATSRLYGISGTSLYLRLESLKYDLMVQENYTDPKGMVEQIRNVVDNFTPTGTTIYEKLISIHDFVCALTTYKTDKEGALYCYSAYGALVNRQSVCEGYAEAFKLLCDKNGIDCILVTGNAITSGRVEAHMWNYVKMDDGQWYAVDTTWDDAGDISNNYSYFLIGSQTALNGKLFESTHIPTYDFSGMDIEGFTYPTLSKKQYDPNNANSEYEFGEGTKYYYSALNEAQKEIYNAMYNAIVNNTPSYPDKTPSPAPTDDIFPPESSDEPPVSDSEETTSSDDTTSETDSTTSEDTSSEIDSTLPEDTSSEIDSTSPEDTSSEIDSTLPEDTSSEIDSTLPEDTSSEIDSTLPEDTSSEIDSTLPEDTSSEIDSTLPEDTSSEIDSTSPEDTSSEIDSTSPEDTSSEIDSTSSEDTSSEIDSTSPDNTPGEIESTSPQESSSEEESSSSDVTSTSESQTTSTTEPNTTDSESTNTSIYEVTTPESTQDTSLISGSTTQTETKVNQTTSQQQSNKYAYLYDYVTIGLIVCTISCLGLAIIIFVIKFAKKDSHDE